MTKEQAVSHIEKEFLTAERARHIGNEGMVRVCARRAAGIAISFWLQTHSQSDWGLNTMNQLRSLRLDDSLPQEVRDAAKRLTTTITEQFVSPFTTSPIDDSRIIINHLLKDT